LIELVGEIAETFSQKVQGEKKEGYFEKLPPFFYSHTISPFPLVLLA
jgi:hypothetical protein